GQTVHFTGNVLDVGAGLYMDNFTTIDFSPTPAGPITAPAIYMEACTVSGTAGFATDTFHWTGGTLLNTTMTVRAGGTWDMSRNTDFLVGSTLSNYGAGTWSSAIQAGGGAVFNNFGSLDSQADTYFGSTQPAAVFNNFGSLVKSAGSGTTFFAWPS